MNITFITSFFLSGIIVCDLAWVVGSVNAWEVYTKIRDTGILGYLDTKKMYQLTNIDLETEIFTRFR